MTTLDRFVWSLSSACSDDEYSATGDLDLLLRCMEDEFEINQAAANADATGSDMTLHFQLTLSAVWVVGCYEVLRAFRQRDDEARTVGLRTSGVSEMETFQLIFADLELLRKPQDVEPPIAEPPANGRQLAQPCACCRIVRSMASIPHRGAIGSKRRTRPPLADLMMI